MKSFLLFTLLFLPTMKHHGQVRETIKTFPVHYRSISVNGVRIFYREAGPADAPVLLLLHGFPSSSFMFRDLIATLKDRYHIIAPDYPGFGQSDVPGVNHFEYSFDNLSRVMEKFIDQLGITSFSMYIQDYGAPVGLRLVVRRPELLHCLIVQNGNAYEEGFADTWAPLKAIWSDRDDPNKKKAVMDFMQLSGTRFQYLAGVKDSSRISPDTYTYDQFLLERPGVKELQYELLYDYRNNVKDYPVFQRFFRTRQPPTLVVWGEHDVFFTKTGALAFSRDLRKIEFNFYPTGHFALEEYAEEIAKKVDAFLQKHSSTSD
jgi:pimeloyl-ACP methyl ester carboxylesterase